MSLAIGASMRFRVLPRRGARYGAAEFEMGVLYFIYLFLCPSAALLSHFYLWLRSLSLPLFFFFPSSEWHLSRRIGLAAAATTHGDCPRPGFPALSASPPAPARRRDRPRRRGARPPPSHPPHAAGRRSRGNVSASAATPAPAAPLKRHGGPRRAPASTLPRKSLAAKAEVGSLEEYKRLWQKSHRRPGGVLGRSRREGVFLVEEVGRRVYQVVGFCFCFYCARDTCERYCYCSDA